MATKFNEDKLFPAESDYRKQAAISYLHQAIKTIERDTIVVETCEKKAVQPIAPAIGSPLKARTALTINIVYGRREED
jgi:hypothetical protein